MKASLRALIAQGIDALRSAGTLPADTATPDFVVERPKTREHGDFATNAAMLLAKAARSNPRAVAQALVGALPPSDDVASVEIAGPGFINFKLAPVAFQRLATRGTSWFDTAQQPQPSVLARALSSASTCVRKWRALCSLVSSAKL